jgi:predicted nucleotidyltransferase
MSEHSDIRYGIAKRIFGYLREKVDGLKGFYIYGSTARGDAGPASDVDLVIIHENKERVRQILETLDQQLTTELNKRNHVRIRRLLNVRVCSEADVAAGCPCATIIHSLFNPPLPLQKYEKKIA